MRYHIDITALSKTHLAGTATGDLTEIGAGYIVFWTGKAAVECKKAGAGIAICTSLFAKLKTLPKGINDRLMTI